MNTNGQPHRARLLLILGLISIGASAVAALRWQSLHPLPLHWDEANYVNQVIVDQRLIAKGGAQAAAKALLFEDPQRPPAHRVMAMPFAFVAGTNLPMLRTIAFCCSALAMFILWRAAGVLCEDSEALLATAAVFAMPGILPWGSWFGTEPPLYLAVTLLLYGLLQRRPWAVALATAIGCLSKATFLVIAGPAIVGQVLIDRQARMLAAAAIGGIAALPWWVYHWKAALAYAQYGASGPRWAVGSWSLRAREVVLNTTGPLVLLAMVILAAGVRAALDPPRRRGVLIAVASGAPLIIMASLSPVFVARHFAVAAFPLGILVAVAACRSRSHLLVVGAGILVAVQAIAMAAFPSRLMPGGEQHDWSSLRNIVDAPRPVISFIGLVPGISPPEIRYSWLSHGDDAVVQWLWNADQGPIDWSRVMTAVEASDVVLVVAPGELLPTFRADNAHNVELEARLQLTGRFSEPLRFSVGSLDHEVLLYKRR